MHQCAELYIKITDNTQVHLLVLVLSEQKLVRQHTGSSFGVNIVRTKISTPVRYHRNLFYDIRTLHNLLLKLYTCGSSHAFVEAAEVVYDWNCSQFLHHCFLDLQNRIKKRPFMGIFTFRNKKKLAETEYGVWSMIWILCFTRNCLIMRCVCG